MATFNPGKDFEKQMLKAIQPGLDQLEKRINADLNRKFREIERTHAGRPEREVLMALEKAERSVGVDQPDLADLARRAKEISANR